MEYTNELQHPLWQKSRLQILTRDNCACQFCSDQSTPLHIHHKYYQSGKKPWEYPDEALISACKHCHQCITILQDMGQEPIISVKLGDKDLPEFVIILMVHKDHVGNKAISMFTNPNRSNQMEYVHTTTATHIRKMNELLEMAEKIV